MPNFYIIAGCNGAGKTTASFTLLPELLDCREFVNADEIARGLSPFQPETVALEAGRIMLHRIDELLAKRVDFAIETTLATRSYAQTIRRAKSLGYSTNLIYFWLRSPEMAIERVKDRVRAGGHHIPEDVIRRRYRKGLQNLFSLFLPFVDTWLIVNNSSSPSRLVAEGTFEEINQVHVPTDWNTMKQLGHA